MWMSSAPRAHPPSPRWLAEEDSSFSMLHDLSQPDAAARCDQHFCAVDLIREELDVRMQEVT